MMYRFWQAAARLDPGAVKLDQRTRFPICTPDNLRALCTDAGLAAVQVDSIETTAHFADFDDYWHPFTLGAGPAPGYVKSLPDAHREALRKALLADLGTGGPIRLGARVWAASGAVAG